jgi:ApbE superfamily uncharacterized protein (UPF0280 family)
MKYSKYERRFYRDWVKARGLYQSRILARETDLQVLTNKKLDKELVQERIRAYRWDIENYITRDSRFLSSLKPIAVELTAPRIVQEMSTQARAADVGPMASVAGAVAEFLGRDLLKAGYREVIIENGGDIFMKISRAREVGIYSGTSSLLRNLKLKIRPADTPLGICTSSGTIGHSLSFGCADSVVILAKSATLADAVATGCCNRVREKGDLEKALAFCRSIKGVEGAVIILKNDLLSWGKIKFTHGPQA